ncbi:MAG: hypothetical protein C4555_00595 [Dehalococcoidia bacterium]|nr:MAG: hypothetical protein C4555_00595 [Dehalococcoidia bacterium]
MEQALFIAKADNLKYFGPEYSRLYFGQEFCERLLPDVSQLEQALDFAGEYGLGFTLVTPYVTEAGLEKVGSLLDALTETRPDSEVVFNDYGVLRMLRGRFPEFEPVMGRLLNRNKRGPRLMTVIEKLPETTVEYFRDTNLNVPALNEFYTGQGVKRVELDNLLQGIGFKLERWQGSLYLPYAYVSTTRFCLANGCDDPAKEMRIGIFPCQKECQKYTFYLRHPVMPVGLERKGNTIFFRNDRVQDDIEARGINRLVVEPEIPI